jgi:hypothetical protein
MKRALVGVVAGLAVAMTVSTAFSQDGEGGVDPFKDPAAREKAEKIRRDHAAKDGVWFLEFKEGRIGRVQIKDDTGDIENFWFLPYTLTNGDQHPHDIFIDITAVSDKGNREHRYHDMFIEDVYAEVRRMLGVKESEQLLSQRELCSHKPGQDNVQPKVTDPKTSETAVLSLPTIAAGETLKCVAIFQKFDPEMDRLTIKIRGLTNTSLNTNDAYVAPEGQPHRRVVTEAVLTLGYRRPGDEMAHGQDPIEFVGRRWVDETKTIASDLR